jgi:hypothetical protein
MATAVIRSNAISGTGFVIDVSALELDSNLSVKDFIVTHNGINVTTSYTKTSSTQITYAGANVNLGTVVQVERDTVITPAEVTFLSVTTAQDLTNALSKLRKRVEEAEAYLNLVSLQLSSGGITLGVNPVNDGAYGASWDGDTLAAPSRNAVYDRINQLLTSSNIFTGTYNYTGAIVDVSTASATDNDSSAASTSFVQSAIDNRVRVIANRTVASGTLTPESWNDLPLSNEVLDRDNAYNPGTFTWTCPATGYWKFEMFALPISTGGTPPTKTRAAIGVRSGTSEIQFGSTEFDSNFAHCVGVYTMQVTQGTQIRPRLFLGVNGGTGFTYTVGGDSNFLPLMVITRVA